MKTVKIKRNYIRVDIIVCPYCKVEQDPADEFEEINNELEFEFIQTCEFCDKQFKVNGIKF